MTGAANTAHQNPPGSVLIIGGGTAGWMAAILLAHAWRQHGTEITLMESAAIGTIGVGEGSTPRMRIFFERLGIPESEWMPACNATYKCGIRFPDWSTRPGYRSYYHPFFTLDDNPFIQPFFHNADLRRRKSVAVDAHPDAFFVSQHLAQGRRAPVAGRGSYSTDYAYHFDAGLIGEFLKRKSLAMGVRHVEDTVNQVEPTGTGDIAAVHTERHGRMAADLFVDCTGFAGLLIGRTLEVPFHSYRDHLFNDSAVALPTPTEPNVGLPSETLSTALRHGWAWKIPLTNRFGNGYVYSSDYCSAEEAERELREHTGQHDPAVEARHLKMRIGRREDCWAGNCLAVGLSQGFIEPLEATALMLVQETLEQFITAHGQGEAARAAFNRRIGQTFDGVRDYVFMHYKLNTRTDTPYWIDNRENSPCSDVVEALLSTWDNRSGDILGALNERSEQLVYSHTSWICILAGMGRFPRNTRKAGPKHQASDARAVANTCEGMVPLFPDHRAVIDAMLTEAA